ncbi:MOSC domain-containing protein [Luteolibacter sp. Populi]|uniref:MOSC domain-containing protein n=1 Tax=Luteolibacter sp. Populi TaxID=3230487 RepID=UPI00346691C6
MIRAMVVIALHTAPARDIPAQGSGEWWDKEWRTGFVKQPQRGPQWLGYQGFRGDEVADTRYHGGVDKAVCVYASEHYPYWAESGAMPEGSLGGFGENLSTQGLIEDGVCIGDVYSLGEALVQVSQPRQPCWKIARRWHVKDLTARVERSGKTGYYFRVLRHGHVQAGERLELLERPNPRWTVALSNAIMHRGEGGPDAARELAECRELSGSWKDGLWLRVS